MAYIKVLKDSEERRNTFLNDLATAKAKSGNVKIANALKQIQQNEAQRTSWARIHIMDGTLRTGKGLTRIIAPNEEGEWEERVVKNEIEKGCIEAYERTLTQTKLTPMTISPLIEDFRLLGTGIAVD